MADVILAKRLFDDRTQLPRVCISCGKPATTDFEIRMLANHPASTAPAHDTSALGCLLTDACALVPVISQARRNSEEMAIGLRVSRDRRPQRRDEQRAVRVEGERRRTLDRHDLRRLDRQALFRAS